MKMVRRGRRARTALKADASFEAAAVNSIGIINGDNDDNELQQNCISSGVGGGVSGGVAYVALNTQLHENHQHFASPKRKDCKMDKQVEVGTHDLHKLTENGVPNGDLKEITTPSATTTANRKTKIERHSGGDGKTIGVPLATRAQTRTIEIFFQAKAEQSAAVLANTTVNKTANLHEKKTESQNPTNDAESTAIINLESGEDESNGTEYSDNTSVEHAHQQPVDFGGVNLNAYRDVSQASSFRSSTSDVENIFLQEPVLTLNVDKSPINAACCVKINKSLDSEPIFSSPPSSLATSQLNGRFSQIVTLQGSPLKQELSVLNCFDYKMNGFSNNNNIDNNSSVQFTVQQTQAQQQMHQLGTPLGQRERKPTTPHRIVVCGSSPIKAKSLHDAGATMTTSPSKRNALHKELYYQSPRKSQRHNAAATAAVAITTTTTTATTNKTRRRLNQKGLELYLAANCTTNDVTTTTNTITTTATTTKTNKYNKLNAQQKQTKSKEITQLNGLHEEAIDEHIEADVKLVTVEEHHEEFENLEQTQPKQEQQQYEQTEKPQLIYNAPKQQPLTTKLKGSQQQHQKALKTKAHTVGGNAQPLALTNGNRGITEFFPIRRRSERKTKTAVKEEMMRNLEQAVLEERAEGMKVAYFEGKGRGVVADRHFKRGEFVVEYIGDLISIAEAGEREKRYALDENAGCYMYYFKHKNQQYCIDATIDTGKLGRLVNHSRNGNLVTKVVVVKQRPHLVLIAKDDIEPGEELTYDYGDRSKLSLLHHPWLAF